MKKYFYRIIILNIVLSVCFAPTAIQAQEGITKFEKWLAVGELHNWFSSIGCEREEDGPELQQQAGWRWPAPYLNQDMQAAKGIWIGARNYTDPDVGVTYDYKVVHCGPRPQAGGINKEFFPVEFTHYAKFNPSPVYVDGEETFLFVNTVDVVDESLPYDQMLYNVVNTQMGVTMKRKLFQFSTKYHDNYIVHDVTFVNTGNLDGDSDIERTSGDLEDVYFFYQYRMAPCRETRILIGDPTAWGRNTMNDERGPYRNDADNPENLRYQYSWHGYFQDFNKWNNVGGPILEPDEGFGSRIDEADTVGRLGSAQFPGILTLHADASTSDRTDDPSQPSTTGVIHSDGELNYATNTFNPTEMQGRYNMMTKGHPEQSHAETIAGGDFAGSTANPGEGSSNNAGYSFANGFGPYDIPYGDSIRIVMVEASSGLSRDEAIRIGKLYKAGEIDDVQKNEFVLTGRDSLHQTFKRATSVFQNDWAFSQEPPLPPRNFTVDSRGGRIDLAWDVYAQGPAATGFEVWRSSISPVEGYASNQYYSKYELAAELGPEARAYSDTVIDLNTAYYYYVLSVGESVTGNAELNIPAHTLKSSRFFAQTYAPAYKRRPGEETITSIVRVVPNPYIISAEKNTLLYPGEENKIVFEKISGQCTIKIYTELGELVQTLYHTDGSGSEDWFLRTSSNQLVVSGIYIAVVTDDITGDREIVKFSIIR